MNLSEACAQLNRRGSGPVVSVEAHPCEDNEHLMIYCYCANSGAIATALLPRSISTAEDPLAAIRSSETWMIHDAPAYEDEAA